MTPFLLALPWLGVLLFVRFVVRLPSELPSPAVTTADDAWPYVSAIVPARNEAENIEACVRSLVASDYPRFEVIVVDDRSEDETAALARAVPQGRAERVEVVDGEELPNGWLGKPWACQQGAQRAKGELLLFTDADTRHGTALLRRAVAGQREERADLLTVLGRQLMESFWERLVQPQIFLAMLFRFPDFERTARNERWRDAIANGQFLLFPRASYEALGGHEIVRDEVVEDLVIAQHVKRAGMALRIRSAESEFATRMYRSLREIVAGWSKNIVLGGQQSLPLGLRRLAPPAALLAGVGLWLVPPLALVLGLAGLVPQGVMTWAFAACLLSASTFSLFTRQMGAPWTYGALYPLGAAVGAFIFARSWALGRRVQWKGRSYEVSPAAERM